MADKLHGTKTPLNFTALKLGTKTVNGHVYSQKTIQDALDNYFENQKHLNIVNRVNDTNFEIILYKDVIGLIEKDDLVVNKKSLKIKGFHPIGDAGQALNKLIEQNVLNIAPFGMGMMGENGIITDYTIYGLQIAPKNP